ncbi:MAG: sigma-70 family RNA polymerase sigma factor [Alphaproteobacteria bacterium]|nr:sigma-70 family RNA polymerase sigma factor [Alphaproteobacteria bacterium]
MFTNTALVDESDRLKRFAYRLTNNIADAEDLLQSTLLRAIEKKHLFKKGTNLYSWISKIMFNLFVSNYRRKKKFETQYDPEPYIQNQSVDASQDLKMEVKNIQKAMSRLSRDHQAILIMICVKGMSYADVSKKLKIPVGTVRSRLSRARDSLQAALSQPRVIKAAA